MKICRFFVFLVINIFSISSIYSAELRPAELKNTGIQEHIGNQIPLTTTFINEREEKIKLSQYFSKDTPIILTMVYFNCPMLCNLVLTGLTDAIKNLPLELGKEFQVLTLSFDPKDTPEKARGYKSNYLKKIGLTSKNMDGWHFLVGEDIEIIKIAKSIGFKFKYNSETQEFAHGAAIVVLTPKGKISRYLYGIEYKSNDVKMAILDASNGKMVSTLDKILLYCYSYDPKVNAYVLQAINVMKIGGGVTFLILIAFIFWLAKRQS